MAKHTHIALKDFMAEERNGEMVQAMEAFTPSSPIRASDLERNGLIARADTQAARVAPRNKDAQQKRAFK